MRRLGNHSSALSAATVRSFNRPDDRRVAGVCQATILTTGSTRYGSQATD